MNLQLLKINQFITAFWFRIILHSGTSPNMFSESNFWLSRYLNLHLYITMQFLNMLLHLSISWLGRNILASLSLTDFYIPAWLWEEWGRQGGRPVFVLLCRCVFTLPFYKNAPWVLFVNHPATDTSLCLHLFTESGNVAPRLFWRGLAASYLTDLPMKSQIYSMGLQCFT